MQPQEPPDPQPQPVAEPPPALPAQAQPPQTQPPQAQPVQAQPVQAQPVQAPPPQAQAPQVPALQVPAPQAPPPAAQPPRPEKAPSSSTGVYVGAALLIIIGLLALVGNVSGIGIAAEAIPFGIGVAFLVAYALTTQYGFLVPAGILMGFGGGVLAGSLTGAVDDGVYVVLGGGIGFLLIYALDAMVTRYSGRWWPMIPGGILVLVGGGMAMQNEGLVRQIGLWSPLVLVAIGIWLLLARGRAIRH